MRDRSFPASTWYRSHVARQTIFFGKGIVNVLSNYHRSWDRGSRVWVINFLSRYPTSPISLRASYSSFVDTRVSSGRTISLRRRSMRGIDRWQQAYRTLHFEQCNNEAPSLSRRTAWRRIESEVAFKHAQAGQVCFLIEAASHREILFFFRYSEYRYPRDAVCDSPSNDAPIKTLPRFDVFVPRIDSRVSRRNAKSRGTRTETTLARLPKRQKWNFRVGCLRGDIKARPRNFAFSCFYFLFESLPPESSQ